MTINTAIEQLLEVEQTQGGSGKVHFSSIQVFTFKCRFYVCGAFGSPNLLLEFYLNYVNCLSKTDGNCLGGYLPSSMI